MSVQSSELLKNENREKIIRATQKLLAEKAVRDTTLNEIAKQAGITKRTVTNIFGTKNNLILQSVISAYNDYAGKYHMLINTAEYQSKSGLEQIMYLEEVRCRSLFENPHTGRLAYDVESMQLKQNYEYESFNEYIRVSNNMVEFFREPLHKGNCDGSIGRKLDRDDVEAVLFFTIGVATQRLSVLNANPNTKDAFNLENTMRRILSGMRQYLKG